MIYNFGSSILSSSGDTQRPMYYIMLCGLLNAVLNIILCLILPEKVAAVAIATAASQVLGAFLVMRRLCTMEGIGRVTLSKIRWYLSSFARVMRYGIPIALSNALYPMANLQIQTAINSYGVSAIAGNSAAITLEGFSSAVNGAMGTTTTTFMGQNLGAEKPDRVRRVFRSTLLIGIICGIVLGGFMFLTGRFWLGLILTDDPAAIDFGMVRMFFITLFVFVSASNSVIGHALQAFGYSTFSALNSMVSVFGFRMIWMFFVYAYVQTYPCLIACFLVSWVFMLLCNITAFVFVYSRYKKGRLKRLA
jgi:Na+-driven multidrug efflux pump